MKVGAWFFLAVAGYALIADAIYRFATSDPAGAILLGGMALALALIVTFLLYAIRHKPTASSDVSDVDPASRAGERIGIIVGVTPWPVLFAAGSIVLVAGVVYGWWLAVAGFAIVCAAAARLIAETRT